MTAVDPLPPLLILLRQRVYPTHNLRLFLSLCGLDIGVNYTWLCTALLARPLCRVEPTIITVNIFQDGAF